MRWLPWLKKDEDDVPTSTNVRKDESLDEAAARHAVFSLAGIIQAEAKALELKAQGLMKEMDSARHPPAS